MLAALGRVLARPIDVAAFRQQHHFISSMCVFWQFSKFLIAAF
jgi:hypothetical protein